MLYQQCGGESVRAVAESFHPVLAKNPASARGVFVSLARYCLLGRQAVAAYGSGPPALLPGSTVQSARPGTVMPRASARQVRPSGG
jgi:hypothetical protein